MTSPSAPTVAVPLGDPAGIGPELVAKLAARADWAGRATVALVGEDWAWAEGQRVAGAAVAVEEIAALRDLRTISPSGRPLFLPLRTAGPDEVPRGQASAPGGACALAGLQACVDAALAGAVDAICFAPLNKQAMKLAGLRYDDELHFFADAMGVKTYICELNVLDGLWTSRITSHVPLRDVVRHLSADRIKDAARLLDRSLRAAGVARPRIAVAALNPHAGEGGTCGREEIELIEPALREIRGEGLPVDGPFAADTIFLRARAGLYDGVVTMYHDQGQIALKLMGFERGVTVQGGLPLPITTPAHGTAFDIVGQNKARAEAMAEAFTLACRMAAHVES
jgi:4-hydroxythreonine-4-phosphate dehydrogenase